MFVCPQKGGSGPARGGVRSSRGEGVGQVQPEGGGVGQVQPGGRGGSGPAWGGGVGQVQLGGRGGSGPAGGKGWVRSSWGGGGVGQVQPGGRGGSGPARGEEGWVRSSRGGGGSAKIAQHRKYLLHGGRYASCIHAGGLSCFNLCLLSSAAYFSFK